MNNSLSSSDVNSLATTHAFNRKHWLTQSLRLLKNELRRGELTIVFLAIVLAVATVFSLTGFSGQVQQAILANSTNTIAADRVLSGRTQASKEILAKSESLNLSLARKIYTETMVFAQDKMLLSQLYAVSQSYPLRGELTVKTRQDQNISTVVNAPAQGEVWVESSLLTRLNVNLGDDIDIGYGQFKIAGVLDNIPDRSYRIFVAGPSILINIKDMAKTQLIQPGSRVWYMYLFAGEAKQVDEFEPVSYTHLTLPTTPYV